MDWVFYIILHFNILITVQGSSKSIEFLQDLASKIPTDCTLYLFYTKPFITENPEFWDNVLNFPGNLLEERKEMMSYDFGIPKLEPNNKTRRFQDMKQHRQPRCDFPIFGLHSISSETLQEVYNFIQKLTGIFRKNEAYFVFLVNKYQDVTKVLSRPPFAKEIKYKVGVALETAQPSLILTFCFYCDKGQGSVVALDRRKGQGPTAPFPNLMKSFLGANLLLSVPLECMWLNEIHFLNGGWKPIRGSYISLVLELSRTLNFTPVLFPSSGGTTGVRSKNGTWDGSTGDALYGKADIGMSTGRTFSRNQVVEFTFPVSYESLTFSTSIPAPYYTWTAMFKPLSPECWLYIWISVFGIVGVLLTFNKIARDEDSYGKVWTFTLKALVEQDEDSLNFPHSGFIRSVTLFWLLTSLILTTAYKSKLVSLLAYPLIEDPPETFRQLANSDYDIHLFKTGSAYYLFKTSENRIYRELFGRMEMHTDDIKCIQNAVSQRSSCISWANHRNYVVNKNMSDRNGRFPVYNSPDTMFSVAGGMVMRKLAVFAEEVNKVIMMAQDGGVIQKWTLLDRVFVLRERKDWEESRNITRVSYLQTEQNPALTIPHLMGAFYLLGTGLLLAGGWLLTEVFRYNSFKKMCK